MKVRFIVECEISDDHTQEDMKEMLSLLLPYMADNVVIQTWMITQDSPGYEKSVKKP